MNAGLVTNTTGLVLGENATTGFLSHGGTVQANVIDHYNGGTGYLYFQRRRVAGLGLQQHFTPNTADNLYVDAGGARIDTNNHAIGISNPIVPDPASLSGCGLTVTGGTGSLTLSGPNTYMGGTRRRRRHVNLGDAGGGSKTAPICSSFPGSLFAPVVPMSAAPVSAAPASVPEPGTLVLMAAVVGIAAVYRRMRRK